MLHLVVAVALYFAMQTASAWETETFDHVNLNTGEITTGTIQTDSNGDTEINTINLTTGEYANTSCSDGSCVTIDLGD